MGYAYLTIGITSIIFLLFYGVYVKSNPLSNFSQVKTIVDSTANFSKMERDLIGNNSLTNSLVDKALQIFIPNLVHSVFASFSIASFIILIFYLKNQGDGGNANADVNNNTLSMPEKRIDYYKDFNNMILTIDGILISIVGGFTVASGSKNLLAINGFEFLIVSIVYAFMAHTSLTGGIQTSRDQIIRSSFLTFASRSNYSFWYFVMGMSLIVGGFVINVL